ncbi:MAG TPA: nicotinate-nucleotide--dimethylbenzimidazole phosphoribosyltransferase [Acidimicrobiales bacterium]|nr:nicotinate-nucleotide--dimethylbenzimidazole phosphoribosyltransferase [Acidimicrobiales bacterium]
MATNPHRTGGAGPVRPIDAVVLGPAVPGDRPGARRLVAALARSGISVRPAPAPAGDEERTLVVTDDSRALPLAVFDGLAGRVGAFRAACLLQAPLDVGAQRRAEQHQLRLTKPPGSLGRLEAVGAQLAGISTMFPPPLPRPAAVAVFAGDHGVHAQGVSPWPQEVTAQMVGNFLAGGAAINVLARQAGADVVVVDVGVAAELPEVPDLLVRKVRAGTADLALGPAMTIDDAKRALDIGAAVAARLVNAGARCLVTGDMGIANTTPASALIAALIDRPASGVTGRGTGIDDDRLRHKTELVADAADRARHRHGDDALAILAEVGGLEHAALAGFVAGATALQVPVVVDGVISASALLVASRLLPGVEQGVIAGHRSSEPGASAVLGELGLRPMIDLELRLGEGTGAVLALPLVEAAARVLAEMATFDQAGVTEK